MRGTSGFEALRLLAKEFSLRSRAEAAFFKPEFMSKTFKAQTGPTQISDLVWQMDVGLSKYPKLVDTLPQHCNKTGLDLHQVDLTLMLLRSLPVDVKNYVVLHVSGEGYTRTAAWSMNSNRVCFRSLVHMVQDGLCMPWKEKLAGKATMATKRSRITMHKVLKSSGDGIQRVSCGSTPPPSTKIQEWNAENAAKLDTCRRIALRIWAVWSVSSVDRAVILRRIAIWQSEVCKFISVFKHWERFRSSQGQACSESWTRKRWSQKERCMKFQPKDLRKKSRNLEKRLWCRSFHHKFQVQKDLGGCWILELPRRCCRRTMSACIVARSRRMRQEHWKHTMQRMELQLTWEPMYWWL